MIVKPSSNEVFFIVDPSAKVGRQDIEFLKGKAAGNKRKRARLCAHQATDDQVHEMLILLMRDAYVRPHKHLKKTESFHIIEGVVDGIIFDEEGNITDVTQMGDYTSGLTFYWRNPVPLYHTLFVRSNFLVLHETTNGPFERSETLYAPWAPDESGYEDVKEFMEQLAIASQGFLRRRERNASGEKKA